VVQFVPVAIANIAGPVAKIKNPAKRTGGTAMSAEW
jgi:hypothetical protein